MAPRLLIVISILFTTGIIASAASDSDVDVGADLGANPGRFPPAFDYGIPPGFFGPGNNNPYIGGGAGGGAGGWGAGYGSSPGGAEVPTMVCSDKGPCYGKKLSCPKKCFFSFSRSGNGYAAGGGGGGCSFDCTTKCAATC
uniref:Uncharacterized protein n=1 Tax=Oryza punctata TaxID=4537 RepID=A0A0E0MQ01_ORYPU